MNRYYTHGRTYRERLAKAEEREMWAWSDVLGIGACFAILIGMAVFIITLNHITLG